LLQTSQKSLSTFSSTGGLSSDFDRFIFMFLLQCGHFIFPFHHPISNFNIQVSGQNAIYNVERYNLEQFNNQLYGQNAVNGGLTDGITSSLIDRQDFDMSYCYYYVNVERMLPVEETVPKSIQILGQNFSSKALDLYCFIEYGNQISIDCLTGARV
jgi:hypothetical protein